MAEVVTNTADVVLQSTQEAVVYWVIEVIAMVSLLLALVTGLRVLHVHHNQFKSFDMYDLMKGRFDSVFYVLVTVSTSLCLIDLFVNLVFLIQGTSLTESFAWRITFLITIHMGLAGFSSLFHYVADALFTKREFCNWCKRNY
jgi:hypothetical protein